MRRGFLVDRLPEYLAETMTPGTGAFSSAPDVPAGACPMCGDPWVRCECPFLVRFLGIFQEQADRLREEIDGLDHVADPDVTPPEMVRLLGSWLGLSVIDPATDVLRQRAMVRTAGRGLVWRGTSEGLRDLLTSMTDAEVVVSDNGGVFPADSGRVRDPKAWIDVAATPHTTADHLLAVVRRELPVDVRFELRVGGVVRWPVEGTWTGPEPAPAPAPVRRRRRAPLHAAPAADGDPGGSDFPVEGDQR